MKAIAERRFRASVSLLYDTLPDLTCDTIDFLADEDEEIYWQAVDDGVVLYCAGKSLDDIKAIIGDRMPEEQTDVLDMAISIALDAEGHLRPEDAYDGYVAVPLPLQA